MHSLCLEEVYWASLRHLFISYNGIANYTRAVEDIIISCPSENTYSYFITSMGESAPHVELAMEKLNICNLRPLFVILNSTTCTIIRCRRPHGGDVSIETVIINVDGTITAQGYQLRPPSTHTVTREDIEAIGRKRKTINRTNLIFRVLINKRLELQMETHLMMLANTVHVSSLNILFL